MVENIKVLCDREDIVAIANAVRSKTGASGEMTLGGIASGINGISVNGGSDEEYNTLYITTTTPTNSMGVDGDICIVREAT